ncbi:hypothetical protein [Nocardioides sp.]|uniref:hypothetical protein n=1 Tax=Nocardioides sp. TaxID=35761 RepID=UPI002ED49F15
MRTRSAGPGLVGLLAGLALVATTAPATGATPAPGSAIGPGVQMFTSGAQCTGNFVFADRRGRRYVGYAAHCAGLGGATETDGCRSRSLKLGTRVRFASGATAVTRGTTLGHGRLVYSSWRAMRSIGTRAANACAANDFALVRVDARDRRRVNPTVPFWGGPTGLAAGAPSTSQVYSWGQSSLRPTTLLSPKSGLSLGATYGGWGTDVYTVTPGIPGDSGSGFLDASGRAVGTLSTVALAPLAGSNGLGNLRRELAFARQHSGIRGLRLVPGRRPFSPLL